MQLVAVVCGIVSYGDARLVSLLVLVLVFDRDDCASFSVIGSLIYITLHFTR